MRIPRLPAVLAMVSIPVLAGGAIAVANSVSTRPGPQVVFPARTSSESPTTTAQRHHAADDPADHDVNDARGREAADHDANEVHDANDDRGADDPAGHEAGDDDGHDATTATSAPGTTAPTVTTAPDNRDDGAGHDAGDGHGDDGSGHDGSGDGSGHDGSGDSGPGTD